jgi:predicted TIM-barrel fold metal-dependent hydrolase
MSSEIKNCIPSDRHPRAPAIGLPVGSIDTHVHVFEDRYPLSPWRGYNLPQSSLADLEHLHHTFGVRRVVFTQSSVYGVDNAAIMDGVAALNARLPCRY